MNPEENKSPQQRKVFDVAHPGKTPAHAASRPVVGNRKAVKDMDIADRPLMDPKQKVSVAPQTAPEEKEAPAGAAPKTTPQSPSPEPATAEENTPAAASPNNEKPSAPPLDQSLADQVNAELGVTPDQQNEPAEAEGTNTQAQPEEAEAPESQKLAEPETETPQLSTKPDEDEQPTKPGPTSQAESPKQHQSEPLHMGMPQELSRGKIVVSHHRKRHTVWLELLAILVILALLAAIADLLLDAGIITTNLDIPHTDFFKDN